MALKKELRLVDVYAIATGTTLSAGFFLLPGIAAAQAGPAIIAAYMVAAIPLIPAMMSIVELSTAMPRAGGVYYFLDRSLGPMVGTIGGLGTWLALILKVSFALIGMGVYIRLFIPNLEIKPIAIMIALALGVLNLFGAKKSGSLQVFLVIGLMAILIGFLGDGLFHLQGEYFEGIYDTGTDALFSTAGLVYISYVGVTKVASLSEEVADPERNLPLGIFLALGTAILVYLLGTIVMVGVIPPEELSGNLHPAATAAEKILGHTGKVLISIAALLAFVSVANAGALSASRYPLAMSRDLIMPGFFNRLSKHGVPVASVVVTVGAIVLILLFLNPTKIAKLASAFQLLIFALTCLAVIVMRESRITSYDPGYRSPFYPWTQILGIISAFFLIVKMGPMPLAFSSLLLVLGALWYWFYARKKIRRNGAMYHIFERLGKLRYEALDHELRGILKEKGLRADDPFDEVVARSLVIDLKERTAFGDVVSQVSFWLAGQVEDCDVEEIKTHFLEGALTGATPVTHGVALPHLHLPSITKAYMVLVRAREGVSITYAHMLHQKDQTEEIVHAIFFLVSPEENPTQHLRVLAQIASRVDDPDFAETWNNARHEQELKEALIHEENFLSIRVEKSTATSDFIDTPLRDISLPEDCLVALFRRDGKVRVPRGQTVFTVGDRITIIGSPQDIETLSKKYN